VGVVAVVGGQAAVVVLSKNLAFVDVLAQHWQREGRCPIQRGIVLFSRTI
jgi:hypothetical protein